MIVITGATRRTGGHAVRGLFHKGEKLRLAGRDIRKLQPLLHNGAEPLAGDIADVSFLISAFDGVSALQSSIFRCQALPISNPLNPKPDTSQNHWHKTCLGLVF